MQLSKMIHHFEKFHFERWQDCLSFLEKSSSQNSFIAHDYINSFLLTTDKTVTNSGLERFSPRFWRRLYSLNIVALQSNEPIAGNIFYNHNQLEAASQLPLRAMAAKRVRALRFGRSAEHGLEIGFNAGHSALLFLEHNPSLNLVCVDIAEHKYTVPCFQLLQQFYGDRIQLYVGDSTKILPKVFEQHKKFGFFHVDGAKHLYEIDIENCLRISEPHCFFLVDYTNQMVVKEAIKNTLVSRNAKCLKLGLEDEPTYCNLRSEVYEINRDNNDNGDNFEENQLLSYKVSSLGNDSRRNAAVNILNSGIFFEKKVHYTDSLSALFPEIVNIDINAKTDIVLDLSHMGENDFELFASLIFFSHWKCRKKIFDAILIARPDIFPFMFLDIVLFSLTPNQILPPTSSYSTSALRKLEKLDIGIAFNLLYQKIPDLRHFVIKSFEKISSSFENYQLTSSLFDALLKNVFYVGAKQLLCLLYFKYLDKYGRQNIASTTNILLVRTFIELPPTKYSEFTNGLKSQSELVMALLGLINSYKSSNKLLCSMGGLSQIYQHLHIKNPLEEIGKRMFSDISSHELLQKPHNSLFDSFNLEPVPDGVSSEWIVASSTCEYFNLFADNFIKSILEANAVAPNVLIHIIDSKASFKLFEVETESFPDNIFIIKSVLDLDPPQIRVLSSQMRFYDAFRIKEKGFMNSVLTADIDTIYLCSYGEIATKSPDVGLNINNSSTSLPWTNISAGIAFFASSSSIAVEYLALVNKMLNIEHSKGSYVWFVDQLILFVVTSTLLERGDSDAWLTNLNSLRTSGKIYQPSGGDCRAKARLIDAKIL